MGKLKNKFIKKISFKLDYYINLFKYQIKENISQLL